MPIYIIYVWSFSKKKNVPGGARGKSNDITKVSGSYPQGILNVWTQFIIVTFQSGPKLWTNLQTNIAILGVRLLSQLKKT